MRTLVLAAALLLPPAPASPQAPEPLFDGRTLDGWVISDFPGSGKVAVVDGAIVLGRGDPLTGITRGTPFPRIGYEVAFEAMRVAGSDFFAAVTFPVGDDPCTLVLGGWGGRVVGLSSLEGADASENETRRSIPFDTGRWYTVRLRVTEERIEAWVDDDVVVDLPLAGRLLSIRVEVWESQPFGIASWQTTGAVRAITLRRLGAEKGR